MSKLCLKSFIKDSLYFFQVSICHFVCPTMLRLDIALILKVNEKYYFDFVFILSIYASKNVILDII